MAGISKVILVGNLGRDPETRYTPNGTMNVRFTMAVSRRFRDQSGQDQERTTWFNVTAWAKLAEIVDRLVQNGYLLKGKQVYVEGRLESREYQDQQGQTRFSLDVSATELQLLGSRADAEGGQFGGGQRGDQGGGDAGDSPDTYDEVPF
ncbi:MAG: single-stranded DNA-binding protein [Chloroflexota bacterium]|nr:single-stranded DNA-binding protein [Chloroflexota bacterium]